MVQCIYSEIFYTGNFEVDVDTISMENLMGNIYNVKMMLIQILWS